MQNAGQGGAERQTLAEFTYDRTIWAAWKLKRYDTSQIAKITGLPESLVANRLARLRDAQR
ncbi:hypothetical protein [Bradyrhizobium ivorense]|uniref:hypothetical protein n=1 Tax=Bradyrhizobium ivorense TaxID=2511166 RepID=UPI0010BA6CA3|nr:hypothetical protein [Bradyrhizobium ivorense]VIO73862.1 hypothetical protein CI41S_39710 [Bradyrhizobium ivorense]